MSSVARFCDVLPTSNHHFKTSVLATLAGCRFLRSVSRSTHSCYLLPSGQTQEHPIPVLLGASHPRFIVEEDSFSIFIIVQARQIDMENLVHPKGYIFRIVEVF